jgi:tripartite-type tricarboxylate transporter receptor subunit TctC
LLAPAGTSSSIIDALSRSANEALKAEEVRQAFAAQGIDRLGGTPQDFGNFIATDTERWVGVVRSAGLGN